MDKQHPTRPEPAPVSHHLDRRRFLKLGAAAAVGAGGLLSSSASLGARGAVRSERAAHPGVYRFTLGEMRLTVLGDGHFHLPSEIFGANISPEELHGYLDSRALPTDLVRLPANPLLVETGRRTVLIDAGTGSGDPGDTTGFMRRSLDAAGVDPASVDLVLLTHAHGDHLGGLVDPSTGGLLFPEAEVVLSGVEHDTWAPEDTRSRMPEWVRESGLIETAQRVLAALGDRIRTVPMDGEVTSGIRSVPAPGHTPGQIGFVVSSAGEDLLLVADAVANAHLHVERPDWHLAFDLDMPQGARTRRRLLEMAASERILVQGYHLAFPGLGYAVSDGGSFRWVPMA
jgi:glyoxylase-like metal-dependent hydrolase (beta-lactamase superfamily II)